MAALFQILHSRNIYNADEMGLYWQTGRKTLLAEGEYPAGGKLNKQRMAVLIVTAMDGSLDQLVVVIP